MRIAFLLLATALSLGAAPADRLGGSGDSPGAALPLAVQVPQDHAIDRLAEVARANSAECRDRIRQAREERGLPLLDRRTASPDTPLMIWAVDRREYGCGVLVMKGNPEDIRPVPEPAEGPLLMPADR